MANNNGYSMHWMGLVGALKLFLYILYRVNSYWFYNVVKLRQILLQCNNWVYNIPCLTNVLYNIHSERVECMLCDSLYMIPWHLFTVQCVQIKVKTPVV